MDEALALAGGRHMRRVVGGQLVLRIALDGHHRMGDETDSDTLAAQLGQHRIDQERHIVIDDFEQRHRAEAFGRQLAACYRRVLQPDLRRARLADLEEIPGMARERRDLVRRIGRDILEDDIAEQRRGEFGGDAGRAAILCAVLGQLRRRGAQQLLAGVFLGGGGEVIGHEGAPKEIRIKNGLSGRRRRGERDQFTGFYAYSDRGCDGQMSVAMQQNRVKQP
jgi:hypothetical protein